MLNSSDNLLNKTIQCTYHQKFRQGKVVTVKNGVVTIEYNVPGKEKPEYRSMHVSEMFGVKTL